MTISFDETLGKEFQIGTFSSSRYQMDPRSAPGPMNKASGQDVEVVCGFIWELHWLIPPTSCCLFSGFFLLKPQAF